MRAFSERLMLGAFIAVVTTTLVFGAPASAHYVTEQDYNWSTALGACVQTKVGHGEVTGGIVVQGRTWSRTYNVNCDNGMNRIAGQIIASARPTLVDSTGFEVTCSYAGISGSNASTTNNYGVSQTSTASAWATYYCPHTGTRRLGGISWGQITVWIGTYLDVALYEGTNGWAEAHPI